VPGPIRATGVADAKALAKILRGYKSPGVVVGSQISGFAEYGMDLVDYISRLAKALNAKIIVTNRHIAEFSKRGIEASFIPLSQLLVHVASRSGGAGVEHDSLIFVGFKYYYLWTALQFFKHYAYNIDTITLDPYYHPNAKYSLPTLPIPAWRNFLTELLKALSGE